MTIQLTVAGHSIELEEVAGRGATSVVWRCRASKSAGRELCALKVARRHSDRSILAEEAERILWAMSPCLPELLGTGRISGAALGGLVVEDAACLLLGWVEGTTLRDFSEGAKSPAEQTVLSIARDLAEALSDLHAAGIAHGDLKPENVMITGPAGSEHARLVDLGLSAAADSVVPRGGTRRYLAPEVLTSSAEGDGRTRDLWALGMLLAELVEPRLRDRSPEEVAKQSPALGDMGKLIAPLLAAYPGARPPATWVRAQTNALLGSSGVEANRLELRATRVRRAYLNSRKSEVIGAAHSREVCLRMERVARNWVEHCLGLQTGIDQIRGVSRLDQAVVIGDLGPSARLRFLVDLVGTVAAYWPVEPNLSDAELLERILGATERVDPHALTLRAISEPGSAEGSMEDRSLVELALLLSDGMPRMDLLDVAEARCLTTAVPSAFRRTLAQRLRLIGQHARALVLLDGDDTALSRAEAAEAARRAGDLEGALSRIQLLDPSSDAAATTRALATQARIRLDRGDVAGGLELLRLAPEAASVLEVRALAELHQERYDAAFRSLERARVLVTTDEDRARISSLAGMVKHATAESALAVSEFQRAVEYAVRAGAPLEEATYLTGLSAAAVDCCRLEEAVAAAERATQLFDVLGQPHRAARAGLNWVAAYAAVGARLQAEAASRTALGLARAAKDDRCAAYIHLALVDASELGPEAAEHAQRAAALLVQPTADEQVLLFSRCIDCDTRSDIEAGTRLVEGSGIGATAALDFWGSLARRAVRDRALDSAERIVGELCRLLAVRVSSVARGRAFSAGIELARLAHLGEAARRLHVAALEDLRQVMAGCSGEMQTALLARQWVRSLRTPGTSLLLPEQVADVETLVRALGRREHLRPLLVQVLDALVLWTGVERGLLLLSAPGGKLQPRVGRNISRGDLVGRQLELSHSLATQALEQGEPIVAVDASGELDSVHESVHALKLRSVLAVPLFARGEPLGVVYLDDRIRRGAFGEKELSWVRLVAAVAAIAIAEARDRLRLRRAARRAQRAEKRSAELLAMREAELGEARVELARTRDEPPTRYPYVGIIGNSQVMRQLLRLVDRVVAADVPILVLGESGTGKELVARAIHDNGPRAGARFVAENCGAIPETLLESALFGHVKGAFTGAARTRAGLFEVADQGTLFLDEVAEMSLGMQTKVLRVLESGEFWPVGSERSKRVDVRVIAATHRDVDAMVANGTFRQDLYYRLNVVALRLPPLRDRHGDVPLLVRHFIARYTPNRSVTVAPEALDLLERYPWPGNVRQLENEIRRAIVLAEDRIGTEHLSDEVRRVGAEMHPKPDGLELRMHLDALERDLVQRALERTNGNQTRASELLGVSRFGLQKMMRRLEIRASTPAVSPPEVGDSSRSKRAKSGSNPVEF